MNHLAHVFLAPDSPEARVGSILGDFTRGIDVSLLPAPVQQGIYHHRAVDSFTDQHPEVLASKAIFSKQRRRFAGVALDILYDHYLLRHWQRFSQIDRDIFVGLIYQELQSNEHLMPEKMARVTRRMVEHDWFGAYRDLESIGYALDRVAGRIRFANEFTGMIDEIRANDVELEKRFLRFFPDLQCFAGDFE
ncbi:MULTISPECIES: ACP phosphodiesterase [Marinobacter]|uniref:acyl carrier protein phosphodiesterase n=1 Tax=Marinobacter TaxID=2742 RepID=UPI0011095B26|nr:MULTISPECIES: ACP phosphodiesterase [Marinobacter]MCK2147592.1 ACP phosphodiesterase [Marinobacter alexandrii]